MSNKSVQERINAIRDDRTHGAGELAREAIMVMQNAAETCATANAADFLQEMEGLASQLSKVRPSMAAITNISRDFMDTLMVMTKEETRVAALKSLAVKAATAVLEKYSQLHFQTVAGGAGLIKSGNLVMTCSYSSTIVEVINLAARQGKIITLLALSSRSGSFSYGQMMVNRLKDTVNCRVVADDHLEANLTGVNLVMVGADTVLPDGTVINGTPSLALARACFERQPAIPFYAVCEPGKFASDSTSFCESGFDLIPPQLVTVISAGQA